MQVQSKEEVLKEMEEMVSRINDESEFNSAIDNLIKELEIDQPLHKQPGLDKAAKSADL
jgi:hypothetical protein